jgi:hypothetical protein
MEFVFFKETGQNIGSSGTTSLSEGLKVNSSLTQLDLGVSLLLNMIN